MLGTRGKHLLEAGFAEWLQTRLERYPPRRIAIIKPSALGDVVQTLPLLPVLRDRFPLASLSWVINRELAPLIELHPLLDEVIPFQRRGNWRAWSMLFGQLQSRRFDLVLDLQGLARSALLTWWTGAPLRLGLQTAREGAALAVHGTFPGTSVAVPAHARTWQVAQWLERGDHPRTTQFGLQTADVQVARGLLERLHGPVVAIQPGARWATKRWPAERYAEVISTVRRTTEISVVIVGAPDEQPTCSALYERLANQFSAGQLVNAAGKTTLRQLVALLGEVELLLGNDSGPMHLAAGLGTPTVSIFTCTDAVRSGPPGDQHVQLASPLACAGSYHKVCPYRGAAHQACFGSIETAAVATALLDQLRQLPPPQLHPLQLARATPLLRVLPAA